MTIHPQFNNCLKKIPLLICFLIVLTGLSGCARNVSGQVSDNLLRFEIRITFAGPPNLNTYLYYIIFSTQSTQIPSLPNIPPTEYFFAPGKNYDGSRLIPQDDISPYYQTYFSTWSDYLIFTHTNSAEMYNSESTQFDPNTTQTDHGRYDKQDGFVADIIDISGNTLTLRFTLQSLSQNINVGDTLRFTLATSTILNNQYPETGHLIDILETSDPNITVPSNFTLFNDSSQDVTNAPGANIISWEARIF